MKKWKKIKTKKTYRFGTYYTVDVDQVMSPGGRINEFSVVRMKPYSVIIPVTANGMIYFVKQHRYPIDAITIELPMGGSDGEDTLTAAKRELEEETGLMSDDWILLGKIQDAIGIAEVTGFVYLARNVRRMEKPRSDILDENLFEVVKYPLHTVKRMISDGTIDDATTISALSRALFLKKI